MAHAESLDAAVIRARDAYAQSDTRPFCYFPADFLGCTTGPYAVPYPPSARWKTIPSYVDLFGVTKGGMLLAPLYWQTESIFALTMRALTIPSSVMHGGNIPVAREIIKHAQLEMIFVDEAVLDMAYRDLKTHGALSSVKLIVSFAPLTHATADLTQSFDTLVLRERHIIPGCPLLYQRPAEAGTAHFRVHEDFSIEITEEGTYTTAVAPDTFPLLHTRLPIHLRPVAGSAELFEIV